MSRQWIEHNSGDFFPSDVLADTEVFAWLRSCEEPAKTKRAHNVNWAKVERYRLAETAEQSSGGDNDYYVAHITNPKRLEPCRVECEDVIQALGMTFGQGEAFKAIWRDAAAKLGNGKPGDTAIRNAEKVVHYGEYMKRDAH